MGALRFRGRVIYFFLLLTFASVGARAQFTSGIEGTVTDPTGAVVPNASVTIKNVETGITNTVQTSGAGSYRFTTLSAAVYTLTVSAPGFKTTIQPEFSVQITEVKTVNVTLEVGSTTTEVTVSAAPPAVETSQGRVSGVIEESKVHELPLVGRNFYTLVVLTPGVTGVPSGGGQSYAQATGDIFTVEYGVALNANGQRGINNEFNCDSASINNVCHGGLTNFSPNADSVQEVRVSVNNFSADSGRHSSVTVNTVTKQGTNDWHGTMSEFHTDNLLQSRNIFQLPAGPKFRRNEGAATFGGPIRKDKTFFFASVDFLRSGVGYGFPAVIATPQFIDFMKQNNPNNISTHLWTTFPAAFPPTSNFATAGSLTGVDCSTLASPSNPITTPVGMAPCNLAVTGQGNLSTSVPRNGLQYSGRVDHTFNNNKDRLYGSIYRTTLDTVLFNSPSPYPAFTLPWHQYNAFMNMNETHFFSPTVVNEFGFSYVRTKGSGQCEPHCDIPLININGMPDFGTGTLAPGVFVQNNYELREMLAFNHGQHNLKVGVTKQRTQDYDDFGRGATRPNFVFLNVMDFASDKPTFENNIGIDPLTGAPSSAAAGYIDSREGSFGAFIQDDWKVKSNLTLNLGLRWDDFENPSNRHDHTINIIFQGGSDFFSRIADAKVDYTANHHVYERTVLTNFGPRIGFAWDPTKQGKMSIRGGVGTFYTRIPTCNIGGLRSNPPNRANVSASLFTPPVLPVYGLGTSPTYPFGFPTVTGITPGLDSKNGLLAGKANLSVVDPYLQIPYSFNWFIGVQYALTNNWVIEGNYIGSQGHHLLDNFNVNRFAGDLIKNNGVFTGLNQSFGGIFYSQTLANSFYTGATAVVKRRFTHGFNLQAAYTVGKSIDSTDIGGGGNENNANIADISNLSRERGLSVFDIRNRLAVSALWVLPTHNFGSSLVNWFTGGWQMSNITVLQGGSPFSVTCPLAFSPVRDANGVIVGNQGCDYNADGANYDYPMTPSFGNSLNGLSRSDYIKGIFNCQTANCGNVFAAPPLGQQGDLGRNTFIGPGFANTDFSVMKSSKIPWFVGNRREGAILEFRTEIFNLFNRVNLAGVNGNLADSFLGRSTATFSNRDIQFGFRIKF